MRVRVPLAKTIYPRQCLDEAVAAYAAVCSVILLGETAHASEVEITPIPGQVELPDESMAVYEFLNYLLDLSLEHHLQAA